MIHPAIHNIDPAVNTFVIMFATLQHNSQLYKKLTYKSFNLFFQFKLKEPNYINA